MRTLLICTMALLSMVQAQPPPAEAPANRIVIFKSRRSLQLLRDAREISPELRTKSGIMLGLGETLDEVRQSMSDLRSVDCSYLSLGQYLAPSRRHQPVQEFIRPEIFDQLREEALSLGFLHVESGPYVRSSYHAEEFHPATSAAR